MMMMTAAMNRNRTPDTTPTAVPITVASEGED